MRGMRFLTAVAPLALLAGLAANPAAADVFVTAYVDKDKDVKVYETLDKNIDVYANVNIYSNPNKAANSLSLLNQRSDWNDADVDYYSTQDADQNYSVLYNTGITNLNQAAGGQNQQGNVVAASVTPENYYGDGFAEAQASAEQTSNYNTLYSNGSVSDANLYASVNNNLGITNDNQAAGFQNQQGNAVSLALSFGANGVALAESDLGQFSTNNNMTDWAGYRTASIDGSVNYNQGITNVNQASGGQNNQGNIVSLATMSAHAGM